jgi:ATP-dependent DNA helicase RecQ
LLFSAGDVVKQKSFIEEKTDPREQQIAREQLQQMVHYAEISECRRVSLLDYFGEELPETNCGGCDNCLSPRATYDGTIAAQKFLSCVYRVREKGGFSVGMNHIIEVLTGADTEKIRNWGHAQLSTYGIGKGTGRAEWAAICRELIRLGLLAQSAAKFPVIQITNEGREFLRQRKTIQLTKPIAAPVREVKHAGEITCDEGLFERLRSLRKRLADERGVPPYIVFSDVSLRQMARQYPGNESEFARINGVGERKLREFGAGFLAEIAAHLATNARQIFADDSFTGAQPVVTRSRLNDTIRESLKRFRDGSGVAEIARHRGLTTGTIYSHLATAIEAGELFPLEKLMTAAEQQEIAAAFREIGWGNLVGVRDHLGGRIEIGILRIFRAARQGRPR